MNAQRQPEEGEAEREREETSERRDARGERRGSGEYDWPRGGQTCGAAGAEKSWVQRLQGDAENE